MSGEKYNPGEREKSPEELATEKVAGNIRTEAAERYANPESSLLRSGAPGSAEVKLPRFADGRVVPAQSILFLAAEQADKGYSSGRWLEADDLEYLGVSEDQIKGEPTHLVTYGDTVWEGQRDENGKLIPNTEWGGYLRESREIGSRRVLTTPLWNLSQTPLTDMPRTEPRVTVNALNIWNEISAACKALNIEVMSAQVTDLADCRVARVPDNYVPQGEDDKLKPGLIVVGLHSDLSVDHLIYFGMDAIDTGLDAQEKPSDRRREYGDTTEARLRMATAVASLALQERLPASYPSQGDEALGRWEGYIGSRDENDKGRIFDFAVHSRRGRGALNNLYDAKLAPRGREYRGDSLFGTGDREGPAPAWSSGFDADWARRNGFGFGDPTAASAEAPAAEEAAAPAEGERKPAF